MAGHRAALCADRLGLIHPGIPFVMAGLVPAIHVLLHRRRQDRRGCPRHARVRRSWNFLLFILDL